MDQTTCFYKDRMRLSGAAYTVGGGRRAGLLFVCRGRCLIGPRAATRGRPYEILHPFWGAFPRGNSTKGGPEAPFWSFQGEGISKGRGPIPLIRGKCRAQRDKRGRDNSKSLSPLTALWRLSVRTESYSPPQRRNLCFVLWGCSACGRATFQRRKVAKVLRACGPGPRRVALFRWHSRPARCPHDGCLIIIAAALLS